MYNRQLWFESPIQAAPTSNLSGIGLAGGIVTYQADGSAAVWGSISTGLDQALQTAVKVTDQNGKPIVLSKFDQGWLANGCPLNVFFGGAWINGQQDALRSAGMTQCLPAAPLSTGTVPQSVTTPPPGGPAFTSTLMTGGVITSSAPPAPQQTIFGPGAPTPVLPLDSAAPGASEIQQPAPDWLPIAAVALFALLILRR